MKREDEMLVLPNGVKWIPGHLDRSDQEAMVDIVREIVRQAPLYNPEMPGTGRKMSVRMTNCGELGWVSDKAGGYRYQPLHPITGKKWPSISEPLLQLWQEVSGYGGKPEACLINFYDEKARMGLHQDRDEKNLDAPVVSVSLGDDCRFRVGETQRKGRTVSFILKSGDIVILSGKSRLAFHGVDRIYPDTSTLLKSGGRINLTLRRVHM